MLIKKMVWTLDVTYLNWKLSSGWLELATGISTTCVEAIDSEDGFWQVVETSVANNSLSQESSHPHEHFQSRQCWLFY